MEIFLAQLFGLYFLIMGVLVLVRRRAVMPAIADVATNRAVLFTLAILELGAGLALVLAYPTVEWTLTGIFSVIGYMLVVEGLLYLAAPHRIAQKFLKKFNKSEWFMAGGVAAVLLGGYLVAVGFRLL
jgi:hypothetical protein